MPVTSAQRTVGTTATALNPSGGADSVPGDTLAISNMGSVRVLLGGPDLTDANGFRGLDPGISMIVDIAPGDTLFAKVPAGSADGAVDVLKLR